MIVAVVVAVEIAFWVLLAAGLTARYVLRLPRAGVALLIAVPFVDLVLLAATVIDLRGGATAGVAHGLAAVYIGVSVAFGRVRRRIPPDAAPSRPASTISAGSRLSYTLWPRRDHVPVSGP